MPLLPFKSIFSYTPQALIEKSTVLQSLFSSLVNLSEPPRACKTLYSTPIYIFSSRKNLPKGSAYIVKCFWKILQFSKFKMSSFTRKLPQIFFLKIIQKNIKMSSFNIYLRFLQYRMKIKVFSNELQGIICFGVEY